MSLQPQTHFSIPSETARVAQVAFPKGNKYIRMRDELGVFYSDEAFAPLFPRRGQPALAPWRLALVTVMQYAEGLTDRQASDNVRSRIDWKYALGLELTDSGFDFSVLSEFRSRLIDGAQERQLLDLMLSCFVEKGLLKAPKQQRTDSTHVLAAIRTLSRLENLGETLRYALNTLAAIAPNWLRMIVPTSEWYEHYGRKFEDSRLPSNREERASEAVRIGVDGIYVLDAIWSDLAPSWLRQVEAVEILRLVWIQQFYVENDVVKLRSAEDIPPCRWKDKIAATGTIILPPQWLRC
ncbi:MAG: transposase [Scytonema sp. RU_4_4]|nr:transposase [Scytonema sp. RU_4_4]NJR72547.1 transposase [Scytonema sp. CRU_2_7]